MYLRTTRRKNKDGTISSFFQLAHNERDPVTKIPRARIIHHFGRTDMVDREHLVRLCRSIAHICGVRVLDPLEDAFTETSATDSTEVGLWCKRSNMVSRRWLKRPTGFSYKMRWPKK